MTETTLLIILDGWGFRADPEGNAIAQAKTPHYDHFLKEYPHSVLDASGPSVGLPKGIMGNSEVGHLNIGAGRIANVGLTRIYHAIEDGSFFANSQLLLAFQAAKENKSTLHLMGLVSDGAVHSHQDHLYALLKMARDQGVEQVALHAFLDGRDTDPKSGSAYLQALENEIKKIGIGKIATVMGRYYAMDRDQRWERTQKAFEAMVNGAGKTIPSAIQGVENSYQDNITDEFIEPMVCLNETGQPVAKIADGDAIIFFNFRADRARQITYALTQADFQGFPRKVMPKLSAFVCMAEYHQDLTFPVAFPPVHLTETLGEILSKRGMTQLRIAETEKYAHVTFFFNGGEENVFPGEERILIPSPREVPTYDLKPEMSAPQITEKVIPCIQSDKFNMIILNFANADMVGHSGKLSAAIQAVECIDEQLGKIHQALAARGGNLIVTSDHGNCEQMMDGQGNPHTAHTTDLVPFLLVSEKWKTAKLRPQGTLADIAPTLLYMLGLPQPKAMSGQNMILDK